MPDPRPKVGTTLNCEDGYALVVDDTTEPWEALTTLLQDHFGGAAEEWRRDNPVLVAALSDLRISLWFSCLKAQREDMGWEENWWAEDGHGARSIRVAYYADNLYDLGEEADEWERANRQPVTSGKGD
jgi:hypothetical protein